MSMEKYLEDVCLDLIVRKHVYNFSRIFKAADHIHVKVRKCTLYSIYGTEYMTRSRYRSCCLYINIFT